ncbi:MAG: hypothetical protein ACREOI_15170 [bacterium]
MQQHAPSQKLNPLEQIGFQQITRLVLRHNAELRQTEVDCVDVHRRLADGNVDQQGQSILPPAAQD